MQITTCSVCVQKPSSSVLNKLGAGVKIKGVCGKLLEIDKGGGCENNQGG